MTTIKALRNFGHQGKAIAAGTVLQVDPSSFGGTYEDFVKAGIFLEVETTSASNASVPIPASVSQRSEAVISHDGVVVKTEAGTVEVIHPGTQVKAPD